MSASLITDTTYDPEGFLPGQTVEVYFSDGGHLNLVSEEDRHNLLVKMNKYRSKLEREVVKLNEKYGLL